MVRLLAGLGGDWMMPHMPVANSCVSPAACPQGRFGEGCSQVCSCSNNATCDHITGRCLCTAGWMGPTCQQGNVPRGCPA